MAATADPCSPRVSSPSAIGFLGGFGRAAAIEDAVACLTSFVGGFAIVAWRPAIVAGFTRATRAAARLGAAEAEAPVPAELGRKAAKPSPEPAASRTMRP